MGRVIRHRHDFGAIILCDERFRGEGLQKQLSRWLRDQVQVFPEFGSAAGSLGAFFKVSACTSYGVHLSTCARACRLLS